MSTPALVPGGMLGRYRLIEQIGAGGMGVVFRARDEKLQREVAIKLITPGRIGDEGSRARFRREAELLSQLSHPGIQTLHDFDSENGIDYLVLEYIPGQSLDAVVRGGPLPAYDVVALGIQLCAALAFAHERNVLHRDIKPANLRRMPDGHLKVLDFGLAKLTAEEPSADTESILTEGVVGTGPYLAPEIVLGKPASTAGDIYSTGATLYELATARLPHAGQGGVLLDNILHQAPATPSAVNQDIGADLDRIILKALAKDPAQRYESARALMSDLQRLQSSATVVPIESRRGRKWQALALIGVCMLLLASAVLAWRLRRWAHSAPISSLAVLPLQNLSHDSGQDYFSLGMTDELTNELASLHSLKVISRTSAAHFAGSSLSSPEIGQRLGVDALIEGSVLRSGDRVRITLDLIDAASDRHLWSKSYDRPAANVIAVQQEVAHAVAEEIHLALSPEDTRRLNRPLTTNAEAYEAFLRAQYHLQTALGHEQDVEKALAEAEHAVQLDPSFARAYVAVAQACIAKMFGFNGGPEFDERAVVALERARTLDPSLAEVYAIRGGLAYTKYHNFDIVAAIADYKRALALNPNLADAHQRLVSEFSHFGLHQQAIEELQKTLQLDPENQPAIVRIGRPLWQSNQFAEALRQYEMHNVKTWETAVVLMYLGRTSEAWARLDEIDGPNRSRAVREKLERGNISPSEADVLAVRGLLYAHEGKRQQAEPLLARAAQLGVGYDHFHHAAIIIAAAYAEMGKAPESVKWLRYAADNGMPNYPLFRDNPSLKKLLGTPDYDRFLSELQPRWEEMKRQIETPVSQ